ncbi:MAG TPA: hypothetical protein VMS21_01180, partial [Methylomirabilota bacterium]|nr:hypothetical protein [Methylomirabilota bacterium]
MKLSRPASILRAVSMACLLPLLSQAATPSAENALPEEPTLPPLVSLSFQPESLTLHDARDERRVLVWGESRDGERFDLTGAAEWIAESPQLEVGDGTVRPLAIGEGTVRISAGGLEARLPVTVKTMDSPPVGFVRDVEPVLSKLGCNAGTCHGSAKGRNGFKLSLRGYDPEFDYQALINDISGRRFNRVDVDQSLMLLKPTADVPHEGGQVIRPGSREHGLLRQWIAEGARFESMAEGRATRIEVMPDEVRLDLPG